MAKQAITEKDRNIIAGWDAETNEVTLETLPQFLKKLTEDYEHDYGTICHAVAVAAVAAAKAVNRSEQGGITGFQAGAIFWEFRKRWLMEDGPARMLKYDDMLFPQYEDRFAKTVSASTWKWLQDEAKKNLAEKPQSAPRIRAHWQSIVDGKPPFGYAVEADD